MCGMFFDGASGLQEQWSAQKLIEHMETYLEKKAADSESEAHSSARDFEGFLVCPSVACP